MEENVDLKKINNSTFAKIAAEAIKELDIRAKRKQSSNLKLNNINRYLNNPENNTGDIQSLMEYFETTSGILQSMLDYKANIFMLDHYLISRDMSKYKNKDAFNKAYKKAVTELEKYNIKFNTRWMLRKVLSMGELYAYCINNKDNVTFLAIPPQYCKVCGTTGFHQWYKVNLSAIPEDTLGAYPDEIKKAYYSRKKGVKNKNIDKDGWYKVKPENSCAFTLKYMESKNLPYYTSLLGDMARLKNVKDLDEISNIINNYKILQMIIPTDKETGDLLMDANDARLYLEALRSILPEEGIGSFAAPMEVAALTIPDTRDKDLSYSTKLEESMYNNAGINSELFNASRSNNMAVIYGSKVDSMSTWALIEGFKLWFNELFSYNTVLKNFQLVFCDNTIFDKDDKLQQQISNLATYNSRLRVLALYGNSPKESFELLLQEDLMDLDSLMPVMANAHTMNTSEDVGRPANKDNPDTPLESGEQED